MIGGHSWPPFIAEGFSMKTYQELYEISSSLHMVLQRLPINDLIDRVESFKNLCAEELEKECFEYNFFKTNTYGKKSLNKLVDANEKMIGFMKEFDIYKNSVDGVAHSDSNNLLSRMVPSNRL